MARRRPQKKDTPFDQVALVSRLSKKSPPRRYHAHKVIFQQGDPADSVYFILGGNVKLSVVSASGKQAVVGILGRGTFVGEGCLAGERYRMTTATTVTPSSLVRVPKKEFRGILGREPRFADHFLEYILLHSSRLQADLVDQLFNSSEKRLARTLLLLAQYDKEGKPGAVITGVSQETLAEMVGTTRGRINFFMNKFRKLGFLDYNGGLRIHRSLLNVVLHD